MGMRKAEKGVVFFFTELVSVQQGEEEEKEKCRFYLRACLEIKKRKKIGLSRFNDSIRGDTPKAYIVETLYHGEIGLIFLTVLRLGSFYCEASHCSSYVS